MNEFLNWFGEVIQFTVSISGKHARNKSDVFFGHLVLFLFTAMIVGTVFLVVITLKTPVMWMIALGFISLCVMISLNRLLWLLIAKGIGKVLHACNMLKKFEEKLEETP